MAGPQIGKPIRVKFAGGGDGIIRRPDGMTDKDWQEQLLSVNAQEQESSLQRYIKKVGPNGPAEAFIWMASMGTPAAGILEKWAPAAVREAAPTLTRLASKVGSRIGLPTLAGAAGGGVEAIQEEGDPLSRVGIGAAKGIAVGLLGPGSEQTMNVLSRTMLGRAIRSGDQKAMGAIMSELVPELQKGGTIAAQDVWKAITRGDLKGIAGARIRDGINTAASLSKEPGLSLPELGKYLAELKDAEFPRPRDDFFDVGAAMDAFHRLGRIGYREGEALQSKTGVSAQALRRTLEPQIADALGPAANQEWIKGKGGYMQAQNLYEFFQKTDAKIFPKGEDGGFNMRELQMALTAAYNTTTSAKQLLKDSYEQLMHESFRGGKRVYDVPGSGGAWAGAAAGAGIGAGTAAMQGEDWQSVMKRAALGAGAGAAGGHFYSGGQSLGVPRVPQYAGAPLQLPHGVLDPLAAFTVTQAGKLVPSSLPEGVSP